MITLVERPPDAGSTSQRAEFVRFYVAAYQPLCVLLCAMLGDHARVRRAVAEAFADSWSQWPVVRNHPDLPGWVRRAAIAAYRGPEQRVRALARIGSAPHPQTPEQPLFDALAQLPEVQRTALVLRHMAGLTASDIAVEEGTSAKDIELRMRHGHLALTRRLGPGTVATAWEDARQATPLEPAAPSVTSVFRLATKRRRTIWVASLGVMLAWLLGTQTAISQSADAPAVPPPTTQLSSSETAAPTVPPTSLTPPAPPALGPAKRPVPRTTRSTGSQARGRSSRPIPRSAYRPLWGPQPGFPRPGWGFVRFFRW